MAAQIKTIRHSLALSLLAFLLAAAPLAQAAGGRSSEVEPYGKSYGEWSAAWWQWALAIPVHRPPIRGNVYHPLVDLTGKQCGVGQSGPVWFLGAAVFQAGTSGPGPIVRDDCVVPASKALFLPVLNAECSPMELDNGCTTDVGSNRQAIAGVIDLATHLAADVDGAAAPVTRVDARDRQQSPQYCFRLAPDDILSFTGAGPYRPGEHCGAVSDGYYVMFAPLPAGAHTLHVHAEIPDFGLALDVTYHLTVK